MQFSMTRGDGSIETAPQAAALAPAPAPVRQPHAEWTALRAKLDASLAPLGPMILDAWHRRPFRQWKPTRRGYIAAGAAAAAISGLVALGRFGSSMPTPPEAAAPAIIDPVPVAVAPVTPELAPADKQEAVPAAVPAQPVHARRRRRVRHRPPGG